MHSTRAVQSPLTISVDSATPDMPARPSSDGTVSVVSNDPARSTRNDEAWSQTFGWGLLMAFDAETDWELPEQAG